MPNLQQQAQNVVVQAQVQAQQQTQAAQVQQQQVTSDIASLKQKLGDLESQLQGGLKPSMSDVDNLFAALSQKLDALSASQAALVQAQADLGAANIKLATANAANADLTAKLAQIPGGGTSPAVQKTKDGQVVVSAPVTAGIALGALVIGAGASWWAKGYWDKRKVEKAVKAKEIEDAAEEEAKKAKRLKK